MESALIPRAEFSGHGRAAPCTMALFRRVLFGVLVFVSLASDVLADGNVTLEAITIYTTHEWFGLKPTVYFQCLEEQKVYLPDVQKKNVLYSFEGQESWQPLTALIGSKCKRCGIYEEDTVKTDDTFYEWELCPKTFADDGRAEVFRDKQFNATFVCGDCVPRDKDVEERPSIDQEVEEKKEGGGTLAFLIFVLVLVVLVGLAVIAYTKWKQKQRAEQQARFVKMFEDDDELDAELGLKDGL